MEYLIFMDVSGDINGDVAKEARLRFIPMEYSIGNEMRVCKNIESEGLLRAFYEGQRKGDLTKTSQVSPYMYEEYFEPYMKQGYSILYLSLSSGLSATFRSACMAQEALKEKFPELDLYPVDTLAATGGMGILTERAIRNKAAGMKLEDNYNDLVAASKRIRHWFMVQDLMYLKRGGRVSAATAAVGTVLNVRPILKINEEGKLITISKKRGNKAAITELVDYWKESYDENSGDVIYVVDSDAKDLGDLLQQKIKEECPNAVVRRSILSPIIGAHTGPGLAAICHMGKEPQQKEPEENELEENE